jgi:chemotaxis receptor (MCP) glutamine deamidase CheD
MLLAGAGNLYHILLTSSTKSTTASYKYQRTSQESIIQTDLNSGASLAIITPAVAAGEQSAQSNIYGYF